MGEEIALFPSDFLIDKAALVCVDLRVCGGRLVFVWKPFRKFIFRFLVVCRLRLDFVSHVEKYKVRCMRFLFRF